MKEYVSSTFKHRFKLQTRDKSKKTKINLASLLAATGLFTSGFMNPPAVAAGGIWLSATNSLTYLNQQTYFGSGTLQDPYYGDFDYIFGHLIPESTVVHLGGGIFWTKGWNRTNLNVFEIPAGVTVQGQSEEFTTIRRATNFAGYLQQDLTVLRSDYSNVTVCNLTIDCNAFDFYNQNWSNAIIGIALTGSGETLEHVTDINGLGFQYAPEGFQLVVGHYEQGGNKVFGCTVSNFLGTYGDGIAPGGDCLVEGNYVYFPVQQAGEHYHPRFGINVVGSAKGSLIVGNHVYGGGDGFHNDTGGDTNLVIVNNVFESVGQGVNLTGDTRPYNSVIISHNLMTQETNYPFFQDQMFMVDFGTKHPGQTNLNIVVDGNIIRYYQDTPFTSDGSQGAIYIYGGYPNQLNQNISLINNQIDARMPVEFNGSISNLYATGNIPLNGTNFAVGNGNAGLTNFVPDP